MTNYIKNITSISTKKHGIVPVTKGKLFLFHRKEFLPEVGMLGWSNNTGYFICRGKYTKQHIEKNEIHVVQPLIISEVEEVDVNKKVLQRRSDSDIEVFTIKNEYTRARDIQKVVLADGYNFSESDLLEIVTYKFKDGDEVFVECQNNGFVVSTHEDLYVIKTDGRKNVTLHKEEKIYSERDLIKFVSWYSGMNEDQVKRQLERFENIEKLSLRKTEIENDPLFKQWNLTNEDITYFALQQKYGEDFVQLFQ